jgi:hypothetical protein
VRVQPGIARVEDTVVFLLGALRVIAQALHVVRSLGPRAVKLDA